MGSQKQDRFSKLPCLVEGEVLRAEAAAGRTEEEEASDRADPGLAGEAGREAEEEDQADRVDLLAVVTADTTTGVIGEVS